MDNTNVSSWKLFRCIYDQMGQFAIEGEGDDGQFEKALEKDYGEVGWLIGIPISHNGHIIVRVMLEGNKEVLEYVLTAVQNE